MTVPNSCIRRSGFCLFLAGLLLSATAQAAPPATPGAVSPAGATAALSRPPDSDDSDFSPLQSVRSSDGVLTVTMEAREETVQIDQVSFAGAVYNHQYAGPLLRVHPGDVMKIRLVNHTTRATNLHFHGIDTSPRGNSDNMHILVQPGETFDYAVLIPLTQPPGLYWYHDHNHHVSRRNVMDGLSGPLLVEGFREQFPQLAGIREQILVLKDRDFDGSGDAYVKGTLHGLLQTINGVASAHFRMAPGETQLWHIGNQTSDNYMHLAIPGYTFRIVGLDGTATRQETVVTRLDLMPATRMEVLVTAGEAGRFPINSEDTLTGQGPRKSKHRALGELEVGGTAHLPVESLDSFPDRRDLRAVHMDAERTITFSQLDDDEHYLIDGKSFDHARVDTRVPLGNIEEWTIRNDTDDFHQFHIHQVSFQVVDINGEAQPFEGYRDTVRIPERGYLKIRMAFTDPVILGRFMYHCHILKHEDKGMMASIEVYDPKAEAPDTN